MIAAWGNEGVSAICCWRIVQTSLCANTLAYTSLDIARRWHNVAVVSEPEERWSEFGVDFVSPPVTLRSWQRALGCDEDFVFVSSVLPLGLALCMPAMAVYAPVCFWWRMLAYFGVPPWAPFGSVLLGCGCLALPISALMMTPASTTEWLGILFSVFL